MCCSAINVICLISFSERVFLARALVGTTVRSVSGALGALAAVCCLRAASFAGASLLRLAVRYWLLRGTTRGVVRSARRARFALRYGSRCLVVDGMQADRL